MKSIIVSFIVSIVCCTAAFAQENKLPSIDKEWTIEDYKSFNNYLNTISLDSYPTLKNEKTKALFQKIISSDYKSFLRDEAISLDVKGPYMMNYQKNIGEVLSKYLAGYAKGNDFGIELMHLEGTAIDISAEMIPMIREFMKTLDKNDKTYQVRMNGIKQMRLGLKQQLEGVWIIIRDTENLSTEERIILSEYFLNAAVSILNFIDPADKKEFVTKVKKYIPFEPNQKVKTLLSQLLSKV